MSHILEYYNTGDDNVSNFYGTLWVGQTVTPPTIHKITSVKLLLYRVGSPGTITVSIRATDIDGHSTGGDLCSGTTDGDTLTTDTAGEWIEITLSAGYTSAASTQHAIVVRATGGDASNTLRWRSDNTSATYTGGCYEISTDSGASWSSYTLRDLMFEEWGTAINTISAEVSLGTGLTVSRLITTSRSASNSFGTGLTVSRLANYPRSSSLSMGFALTVSRAISIGRSVSNSLGLVVTVTRAITKSASATLGLEATASRFRGISRTASHALGLAATVTKIKGFSRTASHALGLAATVSRAITIVRTASAILALEPTTVKEKNYETYLCIASQDNGSIKTGSSVGASWTDCAKDLGGALDASYFAQFDNRLCVINYQNAGFSYSLVNDIESNWTEKPNYPNLPVRFTGLFVGKDATDTPTLYFLTPKGMYYLDAPFGTNVFGPTEVTWEEDSTSGKKGLYFRGDNYVAVGKGIYKLHGAEVSLVGPDMDDGLPEELQGAVTDMIGVGFWLVIAIDGGGSNKSSILKRYITGNHWHPVYITSAVNSSIKSLCWDNGTLYFGEGTSVKSLPFPVVTDNINKLSTQVRAASGSLTYPYFHSVFETMPKVAHKVWATTRDCNSNDKITISYRRNEETTFTSLGSFTSSPRPTALPFPASGDSIGLEFERIQLKASFARGDTTTNSPKLESLVLEYRVVPPTLWGWVIKVNAVTTGDRKAKEIIDALKTAIESKTLLSFYPDGDKAGTEYFVQVSEMPGNEKGTEFGTEGLYTVMLKEVID